MKFLAFALAIFLSASFAPAMDIAVGGAAKAVIVVDRDAPPPDQHAAGELAAFLNQVTGANFQVTHDPPRGEARILVGPDAARFADAKFSVDGLGSEGLIIRTQGNDLILAGGETRGTLYAVYTFLEDNVGCHWWTPTVSTIPSQPNLSIGDLNVRYVPSFEFRETDDPNAEDGDWSVRNKFNGSYQRLTAEQGGRHSFIANAKWGEGGTFWTLIPPEIYYKTHPEWYSLINGVRSIRPDHSSLCLTNEEMRHELVRNQELALQWLGRSDVDMVAIAQNDDWGEPNRCQCDECVAVEKEEGAPSGLVLRFVNSVAADLEKDYPKMTFTTLAYHYTRKPPLHVKPRHNVVVQLCDIECAFSVPLYDDRNSDFRSDLLGWIKICPRLYFWDYVGNFRCPIIPHPYFRVLGLNMKYLAGLGVKGIFGESPAARDPGDPFAALRTWVLGKLYWHPNADPQKLIEQFCHGYYGPAGDPIIQFLNLMEDSVHTSGDALGMDTPATAKFLSFDNMCTAWTQLQAADNAVKDDPAIEPRVKSLQLSVMYVFLTNWDDFRSQAQTKNVTWPMPDTIDKLGAQFRELALANGVTFTRIHLPRRALRAIQ